MSTEETQRFTAYAGAYDAGRPTYPPEAVDRVFEGLGDPEFLVIADLGAGTGISSRLFAERGARVHAVEPNAAMRAKGGDSPGVTWIDAKAERTGLEAASIDLVAAFQAFHWFEPGPTFAEIKRILKPGGRAAVVFYERDERDPFTHAYGDIIRRFQTDETEQRRFNALDGFATWSGWKSIDRSAVAGDHVLDAAGIRDRIKSTSYVPQSGPKNEEMLAALDALFPRFGKDGRVRMVLETHVVLASP